VGNNNKKDDEIFGITGVISYIYPLFKTFLKKLIIIKSASA
jgi:hypothetical protein